MGIEPNGNGGSTKGTASKRAPSAEQTAHAQNPENSLDTSFHLEKKSAATSKAPRNSVADRLVDVFSDEKAALDTTKKAITQTCASLGRGRALAGIAMSGLSALSAFLAPKLADVFSATATTTLGWAAVTGMIAFPALVSLSYIFRGNFQWRIGEKLRSKETAQLAEQVLALKFKDRNDKHSRAEIGTARSSIGALSSLAENRYQEIESSTALVVAFAGLMWINPVLGGVVTLASLYLRSIEKQRTELEKRVVKRTGRWQGLFHDANQAALDPDTASQLDAMGKAEWQAKRVKKFADNVATLQVNAARRHLSLTRKGWLVTACTSLVAGAAMCSLAVAGAIPVSSVASFVIGMMTLQGTMWQSASLRGERERAAIKVQRNATIGKELPKVLAEKEKEASPEAAVDVPKSEVKKKGELKSAAAIDAKREAELEKQTRREQREEAAALTGMTDIERAWYQRLKGKELGLVVKDLTYRDGDRTILRIPGTLTLRPGEVVAIVGESGAGKSTFIRILMGVLDATEGTMDVVMRDPKTGDRENVPRSEIPERVFRSFMAWSPQGGYTGRSLRIREYLDLGRSPTGRRQLDESAALNFAALPWLAGKPDMTSARIGYDTHLSGGEEVRLRNAQAAIGNKPIEIWDEPHEGLDPRTKRRIIEGIIGQRETGKSILYITHDYSGLQHVDRIIVLRDGRVVGDGTPEEVEDSCEEYREQLALQRDYLPPLRPRSTGTPATPNLESWASGQDSGS